MFRRRTRWIALIVLMFSVPLGLYFLLQRLSEVGPSLEANQLLLPALTLALVVLTLGLAGVLIRNLVKLILDRKRGILGSKLRIKLVFFYLALVLLPAMILFTGSAQVIKQTVEAILRDPLEQLERGETIADEWRSHFEARSLGSARTLADEIARGGLASAGRRDELGSLIEARVEMEQLYLAGVYPDDGAPVVGTGAIPPPLRGRMMELAASIADKPEGDAVATELVRLGESVVVQAAAPLPGPSGGTVVVGLEMPASVAASMERILAAGQSYRTFRLKRREMVRFYLTMIGLIFIATLFVATWVGLYVARRITVPLQEVAAATREISVGNLDVRVSTRVGDEMGVLVDAFNEMAGELQENREVITRSTADLRRSNRALDERRRYIETLVANLSTAVISLDPAGCVTTANPAVLKILGLELRVGDVARLRFGEAGLEPLAEVLDHAIHGGIDTVRHDLDLSARSQGLQVSVQVSPLKGRSAEDLGSLVMVEDLSDLLRAQRAQAWQEVARRIAHEIKNPLTPIQLAAQRLRKKYFAEADDLGQVLLEATASIEHEVGGLKQLVDEFSRFARMPEIAPRPVALHEVIESVLSLYKGHAGIAWQVDLDDSVGDVNVDPQQIRRVLINLIDNAVAAVEGRGDIRVRTRVSGPSSVRIEVADTGPGIPPGDRDKMFAPYFSTKKRGTGLGLAIVHKVVTDHHGTIRIEDNAPSGASFVIEIPA